MYTVIRELHRALFGEVHTSLYFHALLVHGPVQHEVVCCRSTNTENEKRIFKSLQLSALTRSLKICYEVCWSDCSTSGNARQHPMQTLKQANSRIALSAKKLPPFKGRVFKVDFVKKRVHSYQAHLQRIGHFLVQGEGVWWQNQMEVSFDGSFVIPSLPPPVCSTESKWCAWSCFIRS